ncbi:UDP-N-acetylmuramoyl-tripeptide--D-alanyl-D-alanine ligase [Patescibacteria group bacterium]|nr:UDP-N-acetylmuramoyl-tripeptide--D-alanyl-D-alanine ligase [Patescibacteria group bacterium]
MQPIKKAIISILTLESRLILRKYRPFIVAVTGSVGKTSTKDAIFSVFKGQGGYVRKSEKNMNSDIGLPLTIIGVPNAWRSPSAWLKNIRAGLRLILSKNEYPDCLILEVGADHPGDISRTVRWLKPDIAVITKVSQTPVHVEFFKSPEDVFKEKASLAEGVKAGGTVILFADDAKVMSIADMVKAKQSRIATFGTAEGSTVKGSGFETAYDEQGRPKGIAFGMQMGSTSLRASVDGILGRTFMYPLLTAAAAAQARGIDAEKIAEGINSYEAPRGRMNIIEGANGSMIIDDTYNSSPDAAEAALETIKSLRCAGSKIAVLGDMMELGKFSAEEHRKIGAVAASSVDRLVTVGPRSRATAEEAGKKGLSQAMIASFDSADEAASFLKPLVGPGDTILVKGSQSVRMERVVKALMRSPEDAEKLLVRQEPEWLSRA